MPRSLRYNIVDVFTDRPLSGNPLAVFTSGAGLSTETMQSIAREMNLSETVFFLRPESGGHAKLRIFTPRTELPFAGHPVLGSAWVLGGPMEMSELRLETGAGMIAVDLQRGGDRLHVAFMTQPLPEFSPFQEPSALYAALGVQPEAGLLPPTHATNGPSHILLEVASKKLLNELRPDFSKLTQLTEGGAYVFAQDGDRIFSRYFAPAAGINEDPATGSAAGPLGAHLVLEGRLPSGTQAAIFQGETMQRPSLLLVQAQTENGKLTQVRVGGSAVILGRGEIQLP